MNHLQHTETAFATVHSGYRNCQREVVCGDKILVASDEKGLLLAVIDGLGHGKKAADVADLIREFFLQNSARPIDQLLLEAHEAFKGSQGAAVGLARLSPNGELQYVGVGNIVCRILSMGAPRLSLLSKDGVLGQRSRYIEATTALLQEMESLILYSDGISEEWLRSGYRFPFRGSDETVQQMLQTYGKPHDDVSFLICTYTGHKS